MRNLARSLAVAIVGGACGRSPAEPTETSLPTDRVAVQSNESGPAFPVAPAPEPALSGFAGKLRELGRQRGVGLTLARAEAILGGTARQVSESWWTLDINDSSSAVMRTGGANEPIHRVELRLSREFGFTFDQLLLIYGDEYKKIEGQKHGTDVFFRSLKAGSASPGTEVAARLWTRTALPDSAVFKIFLMNREPE